MTYPPPRDLRQLPCGHLVSVAGEIAQCIFEAEVAVKVMSESHHALLLIGACWMHREDLRKRYPDAPTMAIPR